MTRILPLRFLMLFLACALALQMSVAAQAAGGQDVMQPDAEKSWFLSFIENRLSGPDRRVRIENIDGVLSSQPSVGLVTVADRQGVWLRIMGARLDWNRLALLAGRFSVNSLSAERVEVLRRPLPGSSPPGSGSVSFSLPALPVAVMIDSLQARQIVLGEQLLGEEAVVALEGRLNLAGGKLDSRFDVSRADGAGGTLRLVAGYENASRRLDLDAELSEPANGIAAGLLKLENRPPLELSLKGQGTLDNLDIRLAMAAADNPVLNGLLTLRAGEEGRVFNLGMKGAVAGLVPAIYRPFFGKDTELNADGVLKSAGGVRLSHLQLAGAAFHVAGEAETAPDGFLRQLRVDARVAADSGGTLVLPVSGGRTAAGEIGLRVAYGQPGTDSWNGKLFISNLTAENLRAGNLMFEMNGPAENLDDPSERHVGAVIKGVIGNITSPRPDIARAVGPQIDMKSDMDWRAGSPLVIKTVDIQARRLALFIRGTVEDLVFQGDMRIRAEDLAPFSAFAGRPLAGHTDLKARGRIGLADGDFDLDLDGTAGGLQTGVDVADRLLANTVTLSGGVGHDSSGIRARSLRIGSREAEITADGHFARETADMNIRLALADLALLDSRMKGPLVLTGAARGHNSLVSLALRGSVTEGMWGGRSLTDTVVSFNGVLDTTSPLNVYISGMMAGNGFFGGEKLALSGTFHTDENRLALDALDVRIGDATLSSNLVRDTKGLLTGKLHLDAPDISTPAALFFMEGKGSAFADAVLDAGAGRQNATVSADIAGLDVADIRIAAFRMQAALYDLFGVPQAEGTVEGSALHAAGYDIRSLRASSVLQDKGAYFTADAALADDTTADIAGLLSPLPDKGWQLLLDRASLHQKTADIALLRPSQLALSGNGGVSISDLAVRVGEGMLAVDGVVADTVNLAVDLKNLPLAVAGLYRPDLGLGGTVSGTATVSGRRADPAVAFDLSGRGIVADMLQRNGIAPLDLDANGKTVQQILDLTAHLSGGGLDAHTKGRVFITEKTLDLDVILKDTPISLLNGVLRGQDLSGFITGSAHVSGIFTNPAVKFSVEGNNLRAKMLADNRLASVNLAAAGSYSDRTLDLERLDVSGPENLRLKTSGRLPFSGYGIALKVEGRAPMSLANHFLAGRGSQLSGEVTVNAAIAGSFDAPRLDGDFSVANGGFIDPELNIRLNAITAAARFNGDQIVLQRVSALSASGGSLSLSGQLSTSVAEGLPASLVIDLNHTRYSDGSMLIATVQGRVNVTGPLLRGPVIAGDIMVEKAEITIPDTFSTANWLDIHNRNLTPPIARTLRRAQVVAVTADARAPASEMFMPGFRLQINAPNRIFVRGRGLDVELGGQLRLLGSLKNIQPVGGFNLLRGRLDILAQRLTFQEGHVTLAGNMNPELNFVALSDRNDITVTVTVTGTPQNLKVSFTSQPPLPQDEVLARLIFKRSISELSPFQIAQLVDATAELAGITGNSFLRTLRKGTGLDSLDIITDAQGNAGLQFGRYLRDNLYLDIETGIGGLTKGTVNLDITGNLKAKGSIGSDSSSNAGIYYEKDY